MLPAHDAAQITQTVENRYEQVHLNSNLVCGLEVLGWLQILWFIGLIEGSGFFSGKYGLGFMKDATMAGTPGDYGVGFPTFIGKVSDPAAKTSKLNAEIANGRLAMMAIIGMFFQDGDAAVFCLPSCVA